MPASLTQPKPHNMRTFYTIWFGQLISTLGSGLTGFALGIYVYQLTNSTTLFALNILMMMLPGAFFSPIAGALVDRWNRRWVMVMSDTGAGVSSLIIALLLITRRLELWQIYVLTFLNSLFTSFQWPAYSAATTMLVPQDQLGRASGMVQIGEGISQLISPAVAGFLFVAYGLQGVLLVDAATFLFAVATMLIVKVPEPVREPRPEGEKSSLWTEIRQGWDFIVARKGLLYLLLYFAVSNFVFGMLGPLITPILLSLGTVDQVGLASTVIGLSMLIGTIGVSVWGGPKKRVVGVLGPSLLSMLMMMAFAFPRSILGFTIVGFIMMLSMPLINASSQALWQSKTPPDLQGRVFSVRRTIAQFTGPIAVLMVGPLADQVFGPALDPGGALASGFIGQFLGVGDTRGEAFLFLILGVTGVVGTLFFWSLPALRNVQADLPDVEVRAADEAQALQEAEPAPAI